MREIQSETTRSPVSEALEEDRPTQIVLNPYRDQNRVSSYISSPESAIFHRNPVSSRNSYQIKIWQYAKYN